MTACLDMADGTQVIAALVALTFSVTIMTCAQQGQGDISPNGKGVRQYSSVKPSLTPTLVLKDGEKPTPDTGQGARPSPRMRSITYVAEGHFAGSQHPGNEKRFLGNVDTTGILSVDSDTKTTSSGNVVTRATSLVFAETTEEPERLREREDARGSDRSPRHPPLPESIVMQTRHFFANTRYNPFSFNMAMSPEHPTHVLKIGLLVPTRLDYLYNAALVAPVISLGLETVRKAGLLRRFRVEVRHGDSDCSSTAGPLEAFKFFMRNEANIFFGPVCDYSLAPVSRYAYFWGIPVITTGGVAHSFEEKAREYQTLTRVGASLSTLAPALMDFLNVFNWTHIKIIYEPDGHSNIIPRMCFLAASAIVHHVRRTDSGDRIKLPSIFLYVPQDHSTEFVLKEEVGNKFTVVVFCASPSSIREIMIKAHELNFDNGEYVFFNIDLFGSYNSTAQPWYDPRDTPDRNHAARKAYEILMTITLKRPSSVEYSNFSRKVKDRVAAAYNLTFHEEEVNSFVGAFHDAVLLYALALNETLEVNGSLSNGTAITRRMWNRTFQGVTGEVSIDSNGDRYVDYSLLDLNPHTNVYEVVAHYLGRKREFRYVGNRTIHWGGGRSSPPPDTPLCGYDNAKCPPKAPFPAYGVVIIVLGTCLVVVVIIVIFVYRHIKLEAELAEMNWKIRWEDVLFGSPEKNRKLERQGSRYSLNRRVSWGSNFSTDTLAVQLSDVANKQLFTKTGYYKGAIVAIKPIQRTSFNITKPLLLEIKRIRDLQNDHIVRFIGACLDNPHQCLVTEYCPKGSLQDVLENEQIKLDWMFRYSIMQDIVRGMTYLHSTEIRCHGNLKSTNCVVDSRFVVKVADFGLHYFREDNDKRHDSVHAFFQRRLWTAPELLRMINRPPEGTQKGDTYSFGIICQEIVYRCGVFYQHDQEMTPEDIYNRVKRGVKPYFRPVLEEYDCPCDELADVIRRCWSEDPSERPDFQNLKSIIRRLNRDGDKGNILDNLLSRMEQYANNLEGLVEERTADYLEQKKKAEDLLYMMLPKSVAGQLIRGEAVKAEAYECVTIFFSDICGFTALSAQSTPMQVIDMLNDLYTLFDSILENFDVYKVETIGDAYMVVSGLPVRNGNLHSREIARMSLKLLDAVQSFRIRHRPHERLKLRIGIHSGPVCAGVVGLKMPRYCLFGDTVNTTSRMESNGLPLKIHVSAATEQVLEHVGHFHLELRGTVEMKGKGAMTTYWLLGERPLMNDNSNDLVTS